jgi:hypothetical protein
MVSYDPVFLDLSGRPALVVGSGEVARAEDDGLIDRVRTKDPRGVEAPFASLAGDGMTLEALGVDLV